MSSAVACTDCTSFAHYSPTGSGDDYRTLSSIYKDAFRHLMETRTLGASSDLIDEIEEIATEYAEEGWDGYDSQPINADSIAITKSFIEVFPVTSDIPLPDIVPEPNGSLALEWYIDKRHVFIARLKENSEIIYAGLFGESNTHGTEFFSDSIPSTIISNLKRLYR